MSCNDLGQYSSLSASRWVDSPMVTPNSHSMEAGSSGRNTNIDPNLGPLRTNHGRRMEDHLDNDNDQDEDEDDDDDDVGFEDPDSISLAGMSASIGDISNISMTRRAPHGGDSRNGGSHRRSRRTCGFLSYLLPGAVYRPLNSMKGFAEHHHQPHAPQRHTMMGVLKSIIFGSRLQVLLFFVPVGVALYLLEVTPIFVFCANSLAIIPLSAMLSEATERIASEAGDTIGALLNISLGNVVELILFVALMSDHAEVVQASILGSMIVNLLLILGSTLVFSSMTDAEPTYNNSEAQLLACLVFVSVFVFLMPTAFHHTYSDSKDTKKITWKMTRASAVMILLVYIIYFVHEVRNRPAVDRSGENSSDEDNESGYELDLESGQEPPLAQSQVTSQVPIVAPLPLPPRTIRFADERSIGASENGSFANGQPEPYRAGSRHGRSESAGAIRDAPTELHGRRNEAMDSPYIRPHSHQPLLHQVSRRRSMSLGSNGGHWSRPSSAHGTERVGHPNSGLAALHILRDNRSDMERILHGYDSSGHDAGYNSSMQVYMSIAVLLTASALMSLSAHCLVSSIDDVMRQNHLSKAFIGLIILPIVGNIAEYVTVVTVAMKNKLDLAIAVSVGSAIQIALCVMPLTVLAGWFLHREMALTFNFFEIVTLLGSVLLVNLLVLTGGGGMLKASGLKGALICACYFVIALGAWFAPERA